MGERKAVGIIGYGSYVPRLRMLRQAIFEANDWFAPGLKSKAEGHRSLANWDEDSVTMAVAAARDLLAAEGPDGTAMRGRVGEVLLASSTLPFAERLNAGLVAEALDLGEQIGAADLTGSQPAALAGLAQALASSRTNGHDVLLAAADSRRTRAASAAELDYGDAAAALLVGSENVIAEVVGQAVVTVDFVDRFRATSATIDYHWEERWIRDEGIAVWVPKVIEQALSDGGVAADNVDYFIFPSSFRKIQNKLAKQCGIADTAVTDTLMDQVGDSGTAHALLMLAAVLEVAKPGQHILLTQFGSGARATLLRVTDAIQDFRPGRGVSGWLARGSEETAYTRFLTYKGQIELEKGPRGEFDKKTALSAAHRNRRAFLALVAGRDRNTGEVHFPPSRLSYTSGKPALDTQDPYRLAERRGRVLSWSAESLSSYMAPPHHYGQIDFEGGGRILMEFTDVRGGEVATGLNVEMTFRVKDIDEMRGFKRYFWKATPAHIDSDLELSHARRD